MASLLKFLRDKTVSVLIVIGVMVLGGGGYYYYKTNVTAATPMQYASIGTVQKGTVSSGISATGQIVAANKLDLNVYKQKERINVVNMQNGGHVDAGQVLLSFDKSNANASVQSSRVSVIQAALDYNTAKQNISDPNTDIAMLKQNIQTLSTAIVQAESDKVTALRTLYSANLLSVSANKGTENKSRPIISGLYSGLETGVYHVTVYASAAPSGFSYTVTGLEEDTENVLTNIASPIGTHGLKITFGNDVHSGDEWTIAVPNDAAPEYVQNKANYDSKILSLNATIATDKVTIASDEEQIKNKSQSDTASYRDLSVSKAAATLTSAQVALSKNVSVMQEQDIVAPFSGTVEGLSNVVVGATPTGGTNDPIALGTLVSDQFLATFSLGAIDTAKVSVGQKVLINVTSFPSAAPLTGSITEISSLPDSTGVAQYTVKALIQNDASSSIALREGLLANITIVQKEVQDVIRIPVSAVTYANRMATVDVIGTLTDTQKADVARIGVISSPTGIFPSYPVTVKLGVVGAFFAEVQSGLKEGDHIIISKSDVAKTIVQQRGPGGGGGGNRNGGGGATGSTGASAGSGTTAAKSSTQGPPD